jgi:hypothetical protein
MTCQKNSIDNAFIGGLANNRSFLLGLCHACYGMNTLCYLLVTHISEGLGAFTSPWVATQFSTMSHFTYHYFVSAGVAIVNIAYTLAIFRLRTQERMFDYLLL